MKWTVDIPEADRHAVVTTSGTFGVADHLRMIEDIVSRPGWRPGTDVLFDHRQLTFGDADFGTMTQARANHLRHNDRIGGGKAAILVRSLSDYGRGRQFELLTNDNVAASLCVFLDPDEAVGWLRAGRSPARAVSGG
ncbi:MAG TPA: hypothetical protein VF665_00755 [Longimicrobium sp.]|jgi:hypothetical protein|uniref:hypothetical protein n=1 Tax=Longimicrobium sp. TaxID=2029185 RepID=UPI002EDBA4AA